MTPRLLLPLLIGLGLLFGVVFLAVLFLRLARDAAAEIDDYPEDV